jgi:hypothetical protein
MVLGLRRRGTAEHRLAFAGTLFNNMSYNSDEEEEEKKMMIKYITNKNIHINI